MNTNEIIKNRYVLLGLILAAGIFIGWLIFGSRATTCDHASEHIHSEMETQVWTCSMHPQIRQDKPGKCPICAMDLILLKTAFSSAASADPAAIQLSEEAAALANIQTTIVGASNTTPVKELSLYGTIKPNERLQRSLVSHVSGRIETLSVNFTGESVRAGQVIGAVYSPDLLNAQQELLEAKKLEKTQPALLVAAREKLKNLKLSDSQIIEIEQSGKTSSIVHILANAGGTVITKRVEQGDYVGQGSVLFDLADLSAVWAVFDAYEQDLPFLKIGDKVDFTLQTLPGKTFSGKIAFIDPILDKTTRTAKIRVEAPNPKQELKPEMYACAVIKTELKRKGNEMVVPKSAVLWTGKRSIVYVKQTDTDLPTFKLREIELGESLGSEYIVISGLTNGEEIVTGGAFSIDASAQLEGKPSMMNGDAPQQPTNERHSGREIKQNAPAANEHTGLTVQGLCGMCRERIEKAAKSVNGVSAAEWDSETKMLHLNFDPNKTSLKAIGKAVAKAGHDTPEDKADDRTYNALPDCCKYRK
jgi:Cu(I)/Ag(I) efflux system membrane fusion protein